MTIQWMTACCTRWEHVEEEPYYIDVDDEHGSPAPAEDLEDEESINATDDDDAKSPLSIFDIPGDDWDAIQQEIAELDDNSDAESEGSRASDSESVHSTNSTNSEINDNKAARKKRKRDTVSDAESEAGDSDSSVNSTSRLQKRKKRTMERVTSLTNVVNADKESSGLPSPETTGPEEDQGDEFDPQSGGADLAEDNDQDLEDDMLAQFNAEYEDD